MTSLTGVTAKTLTATVDPPTITQALAGSVLQLCTLGYIWYHYTSFKECVQDTSVCVNDPWSRGIIITLSLCLLLWTYSLRSIPSTGTSDPSIVDRLWSNLPYIYTWVLVTATPTPRLIVMGVLSTAWGLRLTYNFVIKGGFSGGEDYRWVELRKHFMNSPPILPCCSLGVHFEVFNAVFICLAQLLIILGFTSPAVLAAEDDARPLNSVDAAAAVLFVGCLACETVADRQMYAFQTEKYRRINAEEPLGDYAKGFIDSGLWAYSRHPNYFGELGMWWAYYLFGVAASGSWLNWTFVGPLFLNVLFLPPQASLDVTEALSSRKYKAYGDYQARVSRCIPWFPRKGAAQL